MTPDLKHPYPAGLENVYLLNGYERVEGPFGAAYRYQDVVALEDRICAAVLLKPGRLNGDEVTYLRLRADWRQEDLAKRLHVTEGAVSLWERTQGRVPAAADLLLRMRFLAQAPSKRRPKLKLRNAWARFDALVNDVQDFSYIGCWDNGWSFTYEPRGTAFVPETQEAVAGVKGRVFDVSVGDLIAMSTRRGLKAALVARRHVWSSGKIVVSAPASPNYAVAVERNIDTDFGIVPPSDKTSPFPGPSTDETKLAELTIRSSSEITITKH